MSEPVYAVCMDYMTEMKWYVAHKADATEYGPDCKEGHVWSETDTTAFIAYCGSEAVSVLLDPFLSKAQSHKPNEGQRDE